MKKRLYTLLFISFFIAQLKAQDLRVNLFGGFGNYIGDLQSKRFTNKQSRSTLGLFASYDIHKHVMLRGGFQYFTIGAHDRFQVNPMNRIRNLSFQTNIYELHAGTEVHFLGLDEYIVSPYVFGGVTGFYYNPFAYDQAGSKVFLKPLSTEGQGLPGYNDRKPYSLLQFAIPFGAGIRIGFSDRISAGAEMVIRRTFTDYLDDLSKTYIDPAVLLANRGPKAVEMSFRTPELPTYSNAPYPRDRSIRGGKNKMDYFYSLVLTLSYRITGESNRKMGSGKRSSFSCPTYVF